MTPSNRMTSRERVLRILKRQPVDRVGLFEVFWKETAEQWSAQGYFERPDTISDHFGLDLRRAGGEIAPMSWKLVDLVADVDAGIQVVEESETTQLLRDGNGALLRQFKGFSGGLEHVGFLVTDRAGWQEHIRPRILDERTWQRRIDFARYRDLRAKCLRENLCLFAGVVGAFDLVSPMCGHEALLTGMAADPEWVRDMSQVYAEVTIHLLEIVFAQEGLPDGLWVWDDLGFKGRPFMSPRMYREMLFPAHKRLFDFAHSLDLPVVLHSDGFIEPLLPLLVEAGIDCLQPIEVKAGVDLLRLKKLYGDRLALIGGMDVRALETNDKRAVDAELASKLPTAMAGSGYILQVDHSVSSKVEYDTYRYFVEQGLRLGTYGQR